MRQVAVDDLMVEDEATENVDYLSFEWKEEDIWATKNYIRQRRVVLENYQRLENALWRAWAQQKQTLQHSPPSLIQWYGISLTCFEFFGQSKTYFSGSH